MKKGNFGSDHLNRSTSEKNQFMLRMEKSNYATFSADIKKDFFFHSKHVVFRYVAALAENKLMLGKLDLMEHSLPSSSYNDGDPIHDAVSEM